MSSDCGESCRQRRSGRRFYARIVRRSGGGSEYEETFDDGCDGCDVRHGHGLWAGFCAHWAAAACRGTPPAAAGTALCVDRRLPAMEWRALRLGSRLLGQTATPARDMGSWTLGPPASRLVLDRRTLALSLTATSDANVKEGEIRDLSLFCWWKRGSYFAPEEPRGRYFFAWLPRRRSRETLRQCGHSHG
jgi:hypothetical protein